MQRRASPAGDPGAEVEDALRSAWPDQRFRDVRAAGAGLTGQVFHAESDAWGRVAVKVSPAGTLGNVNDWPKDRRAMFVQEAELLDHVRAHGLPAPRPFAVGEAAGQVMLATEWVESDGTAPAARELGRLCARLHLLPPPRVRLIEQHEETVELTVAGRLEMRLAGLQDLTGEEFLSASGRARVVGAVRAASRGRPSLLHLDFRPANLLTRDGGVVAIIDWANALLFEPALEFARIEQAGLLSDGFLAGYRQVTPLPVSDPLRYLGFRLDTALMLALVFLVEAPHDRSARSEVDRVRELCAQIEESVPG